VRQRPAQWFGGDQQPNGSAAGWARASAHRGPRLQTIGEGCSQVSLTESVLRAGYVFGDLLDGPVEVDVVQVAFVLDLPTQQLSRCAEPPVCDWLVQLLAPGKASVLWYWRPAAWPVANHLIHPPVAFWSAGSGDGHRALTELSRDISLHPYN